MVNFYRSVIESQLTSFILIWFNVATKKDLKKLNSVIKTCAYIIGTDLEFFETLYFKRIPKRIQSILEDSSHPALHLFEILPSGKRLRSLCRTNGRFNRSFHPSAVTVNNDNFRRECK